jgi:hypothetical protein
VLLIITWTDLTSDLNPRYGLIQVENKIKKKYIKIIIFNINILSKRKKNKKNLQGLSLRFSVNFSFDLACEEGSRNVKNFPGSTLAQD